MYGDVKAQLRAELDEITAQGLYKSERIITSPQGAEISVDGSAPVPGREDGGRLGPPEDGARGGAPSHVLNFCANNYLGMGDHPAIIEAAIEGLRTHGYGMSSVRFICGTQDIHKQLEAALSSFLGMDAAILYSSCFDANGGLFETLMGERDAIISDALNHASIIDGVRLSKAMRYRYNNCDMADLRQRLGEAKAAGARRIMIATDGVFSMDGFIAPLADICALADEFGALLMVDDSHATGFMGKTGRGTHEHCGVMERVDIITTTLGKALGGASGGCTSARSEIVEYLRQKSRPYLFSNTLPPPIVCGALKCLELLSENTALRDKLERNTLYFRERMSTAGFKIQPGVHPICPLMLGDAKLAADIARDMLAEGIYVIGFSFPVVPKGQARIRVQISAAHETEHLDRAIAAFTKVGARYGVLAAAGA